MSLKQLLCLSLLGAFLVGIYCTPYRYFELPRVFSFYPFFVIGLWLSQNKDYIYKSEKKTRWKWFVLFIVLIGFYEVLTYKIPGLCYLTGFTAHHGLSIPGFIMRWTTYILNILLSFAAIMIMPNKKFWFTKYGCRTMNVYLLHMTVVLILCWGIGINFMTEWYGYVIMIALVPLFCMALFSSPVDKLMRKIKLTQ